MNELAFWEKIVPFFSSAAFTENLITSFFLVFILIVFFGSVAYFYFNVRKLNKLLKDEETFKSNKKLKSIWDAYLNTFNDYSGSSKTRIYAEEIINENNILFAFMNFRLVNTVGNILVGLGVLGTFVGLAFGIADSNFTDTKHIEDSIQKLLSGLGMAFTTSIYGMFFSLLFTFIFKLFQTRVSRNIQAFVFKLDKDYKIKDSELENIQKSENKKILKEVFSDYFVYEKSDVKQYPKNVFKRLLEESESQTLSLQSFSDDLSDSIRGVFEKIMQDNKDEMGSIIKDLLVPILNDLKEIKQESGTEVIQTVVSNLTNSLEDMIAELKNSITGDTKKEMEELSSKLLLISNDLASFPETMKDMSKEISQTVYLLKDTVIENIKNSKQEALEINKENKEIFNNTTNEYKSTIEQLQSNMKLILSAQEKNISQVDKLNNAVTETIEKSVSVNDQFNDIINNSKDVAQIIQSLHKTMEVNSRKLTDSSLSLASAVSDFKRSSKDFYASNQSILDSYNNTLKSTKETTDQYTSNIGVIEKGIKNIFLEIQTGLEDYQNTTSENLNQYLIKFSTAFTSAQESMGTNIEFFKESVEDLTEVLEKTLKK